MIQIYGSPRSSAGRCFLMLEECGLSYEIKSLDMMAKEHKTEDFLKLNPNGKVPCLVDDGFVLWESAAIVQYLAEKHQPALLGEGLKEKALVQQWSFWAMTEAQPPLVDLLIQKVFIPEEKRDQHLITRREHQLPNLFSVLERDLSSKKFLVGNKFSVADLMVGSVINVAIGLHFDFTKFPNIKAWMAELHSRPAWVKVSQLGNKK